MTNENDAAMIEVNLAERVRRTAKTKWSNKTGTPDEREAQFVVNLEGLTPKDFVETFVDQAIIKFRSRVNASGTGYHEFRTNAIAGKHAGISVGDGNVIFVSPGVWAKQERAASLAEKTAKAISTPNQARDAARAALTKGKVLMFTSLNGREPNAGETAQIEAEIEVLMDTMFPAS